MIEKIFPAGEIGTTGAFVMTRDDRRRRLNSVR
jgi:hypothetical protein